jgi:peptide/nickel transport system permease protein
MKDRPVLSRAKEQPAEPLARRPRFSPVAAFRAATRHESIAGATELSSAPVPAELARETPPEPVRRAKHAPWSWSMRIGLGILAFYLGVGILSLFWTPYDPMLTGVGPGYAAPSLEFPLGTDRLGGDMLSRIMAGTRYDLGIVLAAVGISLIVGTFLGVIAGYYGGIADTLILRIVDIFQAFPGLLFAMLVVQAVGPGIVNVIAVLAFVGIPDYLRLARAEIRSRRDWQFSEAARLVGNRSWGIAFKHLLPNSIGPLLAFTSVNAAFSALIIASLGFLGIGLSPDDPEWGNMIARGQDGVMTGQWWVSLFPGLAILGMTGSFYLLGDAVSDLTDPRRRQ